MLDLKRSEGTKALISNCSSAALVLAAPQAGAVQRQASNLHAEPYVPKDE